MDKQRVLVVEDHRPMSRAIQDMLESEGYEVVTAVDGIEALETMQRTRPDIILSDITMPRMDGYDLYREVRTRPEWTPIPFVFLTAKSEQEDRLRGKLLGAEDYLVKPFEAEELLVIVRSRLRRAYAIQEAMETAFGQLKQQIVTVLGHELRTPLTYVTGYTDLALEEVSSLGPEEMAEFLEGIKAGADRLHRLVEDLLLVVQIDSGRARDEFEGLVGPHHSLRSVVEQTADHFLNRARERGVTLEVNAEPDLPPVRLCVPYFKDALGRIVDNAIKFSREGSERVEIGISAEEESVRVSVSDYGVGIPTEEQRFLFDRFRQLNRDQMEQQGVGLGLAIAQALIHLHGGKITVESTPGTGSTFTIWLPLDHER